MSIDSIRARTAALMPSLIEELQALVRIPSIAFPGYPAEPVLQAAEAAADLLRRSGADVRLLDIPNGPPAVYGELVGPPDAPTVFLYAHYDVQPAPMEQGWSTDPWTPVAKDDGRIYGRGAADNKSGVVVHAGVLQLLGDNPPVTIKLLIEGDEEAGSHIIDLIESQPELVRSDVFIIADSGNQVVGEPALTTALRGTVMSKVTVRTLADPIHSGLFGGAAPDALVALMRLLATLHDDEGNVAVEGLHAFDWTAGSVSEEAFRADAGMVEGVNMVGAGSVATRLWARPSISVIGIDAPTIAGSSNVLIPEASALISMRIAPGANEDIERTLLTEHLERHVPWKVQLAVEPSHSGPAYLADESSTITQQASDALTDAYDKPVALIGSGGSIPLVAVVKNACPSTEIVIWGAEDTARARIHGSNESVDPSEIENIIVAEALLLTRLGSNAANKVG